MKSIVLRKERDNVLSLGFNAGRALTPAYPTNGPR